MPVRKKRTTPKGETARVESSASGPLLPEEQEFHLTALGVDLEGNKEVLALRACAEEDKEGWAWRLARSAFTRGDTH